MDGFINFYKDTGIASNKALDVIKRITGQPKAGFLGTLDPIASGILPVALGWGTKLFPYFEKVPKKYRGAMIFGSETDTQDSTGTVTVTAPSEHITKEMLQEVLRDFTGEISQVPPMYSAKKIDGQRLYQIARKGGDVEREPKKVFVHELELAEFSPGMAVITATVAQGTYIRTLCEDIGRRLKSAAHMGSLVREEVHVFGMDTSWTAERLDQRRDFPAEWLLPLDAPLQFLPRVDVSDANIRLLLNGQQVAVTEKLNGNVRLYGPDGAFIGIGHVDPVTRKLCPSKLVPASDPVPFSRR